MKDHNENIQRRIDSIINEDSDKLSYGSLRTLQIIRDIARLLQYDRDRLAEILIDKEIKEHERSANRQG